MKKAAENLFHLKIYFFNSLKNGSFFSQKFFMFRNFNLKLNKCSSNFAKTKIFPLR